MLDHRFSPRRLLPDQARDRVQRVEQEVRLYARRQRGELRFGSELLGALALELLRLQRQLAGFEAGLRGPDQDERAADDDRDRYRPGDVLAEDDDDVARVQNADQEWDDPRERCPGHRAENHGWQVERPAKGRMPSGREARGGWNQHPCERSDGRRQHETLRQAADDTRQRLAAHARHPGHDRYQDGGGDSPLPYSGPHDCLRDHQAVSSTVRWHRGHWPTVWQPARGCRGLSDETGLRSDETPT